MAERDTVTENKIRLEIALYISFPFGKKISQSTEIYLYRFLEKWSNDQGALTAKGRVSFLEDFRNDLKEFYNLIFEILPQKKFILYKTSKEKILLQKFQNLLSDENYLVEEMPHDNVAVNQKIPMQLGKIISERYFREHPEMKKMDKKFFEYFQKVIFTSYLDRCSLIIDTFRSDCGDSARATRASTFESMQNQIDTLIEKNRTLNSKLPRNTLTVEQLQYYTEIILSIALMEVIGRKPNVSDISRTLCKNAGFSIALPNSFGHWKRKNKSKYDFLVESAKKELISLSPETIKLTKDEIIARLLSLLKDEYSF